MIRFSTYRSLKWRSAALAAVCVLACTDPVPTAPKIDLRLARGGAGGGPTVKSTNPSSAAVSTTLSVQVFGSGFEPGSRAVWALNGDTTGTVTKVKTNSTTFVSSTELIANITIESDASFALYDVVVITLLGKKGIGIELFEVTQATDLGTLGGADSEALGVNNFTQVVGWSDLPSGEDRAFLWTKVGGMQNLGTLGGNSSRAYAINDNGQVVGSSVTASGETHAFLWTATDGMRDLGTLGGVRSEAYAISENGAIVGTSYISGGGPSAAFFWSAGVMEYLGVLYSQARGVNNAAQVVGWTSEPSSRALLWTKSGGAWTSEELVVPNASSSYAYAINEPGQVIGGFMSVSGGRRGFSWTRASGAMELPPIPRGKENWAYALSDAGRIGGWGNDKSGLSNPHPTIWEPKADGWTVRVISGTSVADSWVSAVNDNHQAVGVRRNVTGDRATLWDVP
ncbi:MAG TPA: hypothetical protein VES88_13890 [Gemmatimonadaceae bacterium]|nr:hypothetical protein [Gemmatimonadaceae bacterium]